MYQRVGLTGERDMSDRAAGFAPEEKQVARPDGIG
jgi:hypothetical protein